MSVVNKVHKHGLHPYVSSCSRSSRKFATTYVGMRGYMQDGAWWCNPIVVLQLCLPLSDLYDIIFLLVCFLFMSPCIYIYIYVCVKGGSYV